MKKNDVLEAKCRKCSGKAGGSTVPNAADTTHIMRRSVWRPLPIPMRAVPGEREACKSKRSRLELSEKGE